MGPLMGGGRISLSPCSADGRLFCSRGIRPCAASDAVTSMGFGKARGSYERLYVVNSLGIGFYAFPMEDGTSADSVNVLSHNRFTLDGTKGSMAPVGWAILVRHLTHSGLCPLETKTR